MRLGVVRGSCQLVSNSCRGQRYFNSFQIQSCELIKNAIVNLITSVLCTRLLIPNGTASVVGFYLDSERLHQFESERVGPVVCLIVGNITLFVKHINKVVPGFTFGNHVTFERRIGDSFTLPVVTKLRKNLCFSVTHELL